MGVRFRFLPWVREGASAAIRAPDTLAAGLPGRAALPLSMRVNEGAEVDVRLQLHGPGDVIGFDPSVVVRTDPASFASAFEANYFPAIEFDLPSLPWLLTPAAGDGQGRLRPWICLVVVRRQPGVTLTSNRGRALPVLGIRAPARPAAELPDLAESWAWAHVQVTGGDDEPVRALLGQDAVSRLLCPRRLEPGQSYLACLVPTFEAGRRAGLDDPSTSDPEAELAPAWEIGDDPAAVDLPVYYHWEFSTGVGGDFESLARSLQGRPVPDGVGRRTVRLDAAGFGLPDGGTLPLEGALRVPGTAEDVAPPEPFVAGLLGLVNAPDKLRGEAGEGDPVVAPPIYGAWQSARQRIDEASPAWLRTVNLDPRLRAAAGLGTLVVQDEQESLMASAWEQLGRAGKEKERIQRRQLAHTVMGRVHRAISALPPERFLRFTGPLHGRVKLARPTDVVSGAASDEVAEPVPRTVLAQIQASTLPVAVTSASFRRLTRPRGPVVRRATARSTTVLAGAPPLSSGLTFTARFSDSIARPTELVRSATVSSTVDAAAIEQRLGSLIVPSTMLAESSRFNEAVREVSAYVRQATGERPPVKRPTLVLQNLKLVMLEQIDPARTLPPAVPPRGGAEVGGGEDAEERAPPVSRASSLPAPAFPQPMYEPLRELAPDTLLPGIERISPDSVSLLETNPDFIEAYMIGLNHEMSRELLWREYPSDLRASCFRRFWGGHLVMPEIHAWASESELGMHFGDGGGERLVLLVRGELLRRYPKTVIYAVPAIDERTPGEGRRHPLFRAALSPDTTCLGFDLDSEDVRGGDDDPGWFFVLEQPPGQPRFGLDESISAERAPGDLTSWNDVAWEDVAASDEARDALTHAPAGGPLAGRRLDALEWGFNAGHMAAITLQRPVRVLLRAADLLPAP